METSRCRINTPSADLGRSFYEQIADTRPSPEHLAIVADLTEKAISVVGYEPLTAILEWIINQAPASPEEMQEHLHALQARIRAGWLRLKASETSRERAFTDFLATHENKGLECKPLLVLFLRKFCDLTYVEIEESLGIDNVRQIGRRADMRLSDQS